MSILIKGLEMPKNCGECFACKAELSQEKKVIYVCCFTREEYVSDENRVEHCPLVLVPPHGRLIDADEFLKRAIGTKCFRVDYALMLEELVGESTTIIPAEEGE
jgi:hypothetical protein